MKTQKKYLHKDLSWLDFNERVLMEGLDDTNPLLERLKFLAIFSNNLDEFLMTKVARTKSRITADIKNKDKYGWYPQPLYETLKSRIKILYKKLHDINNKVIFKELWKEKIFIKKHHDLNRIQLQFTKHYFDEFLFPLVTPIAIDIGHPFPVLLSKVKAFAVKLKRFKNYSNAILTVPLNIPRIVSLPSEEGEFDFILLEDIISAYIEKFFRGYKVHSSFFFRVIRDSELNIETKHNDNLLKLIEGEVKKRSEASIIALEIEYPCQKKFAEELCKLTNCSPNEVILIPGKLDLSYLFELIKKIPKPDLLYKSYSPKIISYENIFNKIKEQEFITHLPFHSFYPTVDLIKSAAHDENVLAIKMTLYRTNENSSIINSLKIAAKNKKQVSILVEIKARFDEEKNIIWVKELELAGCHVMYGIPGMKVHAKIALIVRKESEQIKRYVHLSTGNYNENTANIYTDIGFFTANDDFGREISDFFNVITGFSMPTKWKRIISAPHHLRDYFYELIDQEIEYQKQFKNGFIFAKMNSLDDPKIIDKLYEASSTGVKINLMVRGMCALIPGQKNLSENINVKSLVGRFLEHSRIYHFNNNNNPRVFLSSADWMTRNLDKRIEILFEVYNENILEYLKSLLEIYWKDTLKTWNFDNKENKYLKSKNIHNKFSAQDFFMTNE